MSTKSILDAPKKMVFKALKKTRKVAESANDYALNRTEGVVSETIVVAEQWQTVANKAIKDSFKIAATNQDLVFTALTGVKKHMKLSKKRFTKLTA
ncbi:hypothetical protein [Lacinutrix jangbogonensis]|uniref:hypothetical protein n=1 Tax=Lacinutrix jangbogonensis TaxID=1469557 RepID=UPI00053CF6DC|nr:hypothetical protein [Lacinutrix jangbogonensis]